MLRANSMKNDEKARLREIVKVLDKLIEIHAHSQDLLDDRVGKTLLDCFETPSATSPTEVSVQIFKI